VGGKAREMEGGRERRAPRESISKRAAIHVHAVPARPFRQSCREKKAREKPDQVSSYFDSSSSSSTPLLQTAGRKKRGEGRREGRMRRESGV